MTNNNMKIALLLFALLACAGRAPAQYTYTDISWPNSDTVNAAAFGINDYNVVSGRVQLPGQQDGFLYSGGHWTLLSLQNGTQRVSLYGASNQLLMVGSVQSNPQQGALQAYIHGPVTINRLESAIIDGALKYPDSNVAETIFTAINPYGTMAVGFYLDNSPPGTYGSFTMQLNPSTFNGGAFVLFSHPGAAVTDVAGVNNAGNLVGAYGPSSGPSTGFLYDAATKAFENIAYPGAVSTWAEGISSAGVIVGVYQGTANPADVHGYVLSGGTYTPLNYPGAQQTMAFGVNRNGIIVGEYYVKTSTGTQTRAFMATPSVAAPAAAPSEQAQPAWGDVQIPFLGYQLKR
jgi:hypothetical protein